MTSQIARETSSRGASSSTKRSPSGPTIVAPSPRIASVTRKPSRPAMPVTAVGWNCTNSRSAIAAPARCASSRPVPCEPGRVGRPAPERGGAAGGDQRPARPDGETVLAEHADDAAVLEPEVGGPRQLEDQHVRPGDEVRRQLAGDAAAGRAAARVHDAPPGVPALEAERQVAVAVGVEAHAGVLERQDHLRRLVRQHLGGGAAHERAARDLGVLEVQLRGVVDARAPRRGRPAPSSSRSARAAWR